jgi:hypothetical protein
MPQTKTRTEGFLSDLERDRLKNYDNLNTIEKKNLNFRLRRKMSFINQTLADINRMLSTLPDDMLKEFIDISSAMYVQDTFDKVLQLLDPWPVKTIDPENAFDAFAVKTIYTISEDPEKCNIVSLYRPALYSEIVLTNRLKKHCEEVEKYYDPHFTDPLPWESAELQKMLRTLRKAGGEAHTHTIKDKGGKPKPVIIDLKDLKSPGKRLESYLKNIPEYAKEIK